MLKRKIMTIIFLMKKNMKITSNRLLRFLVLFWVERKDRSRVIFNGGFNGDLIPDVFRLLGTLFIFLPITYCLILDFMLRLTRKLLILLMNLLLKVIRKLKNLLLKLLKRTRMRKISLMNWKNSWKRRRKIFLKIFLKESTDRGRYLLPIFPFFSSIDENILFLCRKSYIC